MTLQATVETLDAAPEALRDFYVQKEDGKFHLPVDGLVDKTKLDEFRENNRQLNRQLQETNARFDGIDPDKARELAEKAAREKDRRMIEAGKVDEMLAEKTGAMKTSFEKQIAALTDEKQKATAQLEGLVIDGAIRDAAAKAGVRPSAVEDVLLRGRMLFRLQDGKAVPMDGDKPVYGKSGQPMDITEWIAGLSERASHLFEPSQGSGSRQAGQSNPGAGRVLRTDSDAFLGNLDAIASGKMKVV